MFSYIVHHLLNIPINTYLFPHNKLAAVDKIKCIKTIKTLLYKGINEPENLLKS